jgi:4-hydroxybenzoate polyprenyltransferase
MHFIRLMRPTNLLIIAGTMYGLGWYLDNVFSYDARFGAVATFDFFLLVFSTVIIAGAGNIINDYFDIKADRVNRPNRIIIARHIKPRKAIVAHWMLNMIAFGIALYLSIRFKSFWYVFIHLLSINLLWGYSVLLKRTLYFGNIVVALLTGLVPVLVGIYYQHILDFNGSIEISTEYAPFELYPFLIQQPEIYPLVLGFGFGLFAFLLNWSREIVKDMEDVEGDVKLKAKTIPIELGFRKAKGISLTLLFLTMLLSAAFLLISPAVKNSIEAFIPVALAGLAWILSIYTLIQAQSSTAYRKVHKIIKWIMIFGLLLPIHWSLMILMG